MPVSPRQVQVTTEPYAAGPCAAPRSEGEERFGTVTSQKIEGDGQARGQVTKLGFQKLDAWIIIHPFRIFYSLKGGYDSLVEPTHGLRPFSLCANTWCHVIACPAAECPPPVAFTDTREPLIMYPLQRQYSPPSQGVSRFCHTLKNPQHGSRSDADGEWRKSPGVYIRTLKDLIGQDEGTP